MKVVVQIARVSDQRYRAWCPGLPGVAASGRSMDEVKERIDQAIAGYVAGLNAGTPQERRPLFAAL